MEIGGRLLVTYGAWGRSTGQLAAAIGEALTTDDLSVDVKPARDVASLTGYCAVVIGTPLQAGRFHRDVVGLIERHREALDVVPVALFAVCLAPKADTPDARRRIESTLADLWEGRPESRPIEIGMFGSAARPLEVALQRLPFARRVRHRHLKTGTGRFGDWDDIETWAARVRERLVEH
jgi:menaquinone-dependent protoporphyrinogen oxidase